MRSWLNGQTSPEMLYLETKWASTEYKGVSQQFWLFAVSDG